MATGKLAQAIEAKKESKRLRAMRHQHPELEIIEVSRSTRMAVQEVQENFSADLQDLAEIEAEKLGITGKGYTFQVSEGVFTRPKQERPPAKPGRRTKP
jgi:hypothetical protein